MRVSEHVHMNKVLTEGKKDYALELELQILMRCHVDSGNQTVVLWKSSWHP